MPTYDYRCLACGHEFEQFQRMSEERLQECPECQGELKRLFGGGAGFLFKGSGFRGRISIDTMSAGRRREAVR